MKFVLKKNVLIAFFFTGLGLILPERDAFGVSNWLGSKMGGVYAISLVYMLVFYIWSLVNIYGGGKKIGAAALNIVFLVNALFFCVLFAGVFKSFNLPNAISHTLFNGFVFLPVWVALFYRGRGEFFLALYVFLQMLLSAIVLYIPDFYFIDGKYYQELAGNFVVQSDRDSGVLFDKNLVGGYGVFHNPNALGFYSVISMAFSVFFFLRKNTGDKLFAVAFFVLGVLGWLNSLTRGPVIFMMLGLVAIYFRSGSFGLGLFFRLFLFLILSVFLLINFAGFFEYLFPNSDNVSVSGRLEGFSSGMYAIISSPIVGVDNDTYWMTNEIPHFVVLNFAASYGVLAGMLVFLLIFYNGFRWVSGCLRFIKVFPDSRGELSLAILLVLACMGISVTNNITSPFVFWAAFAQAGIIFWRNQRGLGKG